MMGFKSKTVTGRHDAYGLYTHDGQLTPAKWLCSDSENLTWLRYHLQTHGHLSRDCLQTHRHKLSSTNTHGTRLHHFLQLVHTQAKPAATFCLITSTTLGSAIVLKSPSWSPSPATIFLRMRRIICCTHATHQYYPPPASRNAAQKTHLARPCLG